MNILMYKLQMPKPTRNNCENGKHTNLLVQVAGSAVQKSQITVYTSKVSANNKVSITHQSDISYLYLLQYVSQTK